MFDSILNDVKKILGIASDYTAFDIDIITHINSVFSTLNQLGIGPAKGFRITGASEQWIDFMGDDPNYNNIKTYIFLRVRLLFDPPATSFVLTAFKEQIQELEWRINVYREDEPNHGLPVISGGPPDTTPGDILDGGYPA